MKTAQSPEVSETPPAAPVWPDRSTIPPLFRDTTSPEAIVRHLRNVLG